MQSSRPYSRWPVVSYTLIAINILLFFLAVSRGVSMFSPATGDMVAWGANVAALTLTGDAWRLLSSMFLHIGLIHILFNMYMLFAFGPFAEARFGSGRFLLIYLLSGLFGSLASAAYHGFQGQVVVAAGASGALMGICGAYVGHWIVSRSRGVVEEHLNMKPLAQTIGLNLVLGFVNPGVDNACHVGGLISGVALGIAFALGSFERSKPARALASTVISVASLGIILVVLQRPPTPDMTQLGRQIRAVQTVRAMR